MNYQVIPSGGWAFLLVWKTLLRDVSGRQVNGEDCQYREVEKDNSESCAAVQELVGLTPTKGCYDERLEKPSSKAYITFNECSILINMSSLP